MNEANDFYEDMRSKRQNIENWRDDSLGDTNSAVNANLNNVDTRSVSQGSVSGKGSVKEDVTTTSTKGGMPSPSKGMVDLTPNG